MTREEAINWVNELRDDEFYYRRTKDNKGELHIKDNTSVIAFLMWFFSLDEEDLDD